MTNRNGDNPGVETDHVEPLGDQFRAELVAFTRALRHGGAQVPANASSPAAEAIAEVGLADREHVRQALRAALLSSPDDYGTFDRLFDQFWARIRGLDESAAEPALESEQAGGLEPPSLETPRGERTESQRTESEQSLGPEGVRRGIAAETGAEHDPDATGATYSPTGRSEQVEPTPGFGDDDSTERATERLTRALATAAGRRTERATGGRQLDVRLSLRRSVATGGATMSLPKRDFRSSELRGVVFVDVSRSVLDVLDRDFLVRFLRALRAEWQSARVFLFDTDVQEVSGALNAETTTEVYDALEHAEAEWGGGTRIGGALTTVRDQYPDAVDRRTVALVISDGLEMGHISDLESGIVWLSRRAPLVLWLNPLASSPSFEPTASGMRAVEPSVDGIFPFSGADDITELARQLEQYTGTEPLGYQQTNAYLS